MSNANRRRPGSRYDPDPTDLEFIAAMTDAKLLAAYERATGPQNDEEATGLAAEIERRGFGV